MRNRNYYCLAASLCLLAVAPRTLLPMLQEAGEYRLRSDTRVVEVDVQVRDSHGNPVQGLKAGDFTILDNGKKRPFTIFREYSVTSAPAERSAEPQPGATPDQPALPPNTFTNLGVPKPPDGHSTVLLLDAVNGWADSYGQMHQGVIDMLARIPADEKVAIYVIVKQMGLVMLQDYTTDHARLRASFDHFIPQGMRPAPDGWDHGEGLREPVSSHPPPPPPNPRADTAQVQLAERMATMAVAIRKSDDVQRASEQVRLSLKTLAAQLAGQSGRKSIFWFTEGLPPVVLWGDGANNTMDKAWQETIASLNNANIAVNTVDNNGLGGPPRFWVAQNGKEGFGGILMQKQIAEQTGGKSYYYRNDLGNALAEGIADSRAGYVLGFYLTKTDGEYHTLKVRVDKPGLDLNYRQGYESRDDAITNTLKGKGPELETLLMNPSNVSDVGITANLSAVPGNPRGTLNVRLKLSPDTLSLLKSPRGWAGQVDELFIEFNAAGREVGRVSGTGHFDVPSDSRDAFDTDGATLTQSLQLPAEAVKLSIIVRDTSSGHVGSLTVPINAAERQ